MTRPSLFYTSLMAMLLTADVMPATPSHTIETNQSPESAKRKIDAAKAKREMRAAKRKASAATQTEKEKQ